MRVKNETLISSTVSLAASANLTAVWLGHVAQYSIQLAFTGTPAGAFKLQASDDVGNIDGAAISTQVAAITNWTDIDNSSQTIAAAGTCMWNIADCGYEWVRVVWTASGAGSGTPTLTTARCKTKGI